METVFLAAFLIDLAFNYICANNKIKYLLSSDGFTDMIALVPVIFIVLQIFVREVCAREHRPCTAPALGCRRISSTRASGLGPTARVAHKPSSTVLFVPNIKSLFPPLTVRPVIIF
jgi:hypothetical protein